MSTASLISIILFALSTLMCVVFIIITYHRRSADLQVVYMCCLVSAFGLRLFFFVQYEVVQTVASLVVDNACYIGLVSAKMLALCLWHECGIALSTNTPSSGMNHLNPARRQFRRVGMCYLVFFASSEIALSLWVGYDFSWQQDAILFGTTSTFANLVFLIVNAILLGCACILYGVKLYRNAHLYQLKYATDMGRLKQLSVGALVICISFFGKASYDITIMRDPSAIRICDFGATKQAEVCWSSFYLSTEWLPNSYFVILLFVFTFWERRRRTSAVLSAPLVKLSQEDAV